MLTIVTEGGVARVVVGLRHPLQHLRSEAIRALQAAGVQVDVLREARCAAAPADEDATYAACLAANEVRQQQHTQQLQQACTCTHRAHQHHMCT